MRKIIPRRLGGRAFKVNALKMVPGESMHQLSAIVMTALLEANNEKTGGKVIFFRTHI